MTVVVAALGSTGDVHPKIALARALKDRGHRVVLVAGVVFGPLAERAGLEFVGLGTEKEFEEAIRDPDIWHPYRGFSVVCRRLMLPYMRQLYEIIAELNTSGRTVVVAPVTALGARVANEKLGVTLATVHLQPAMLRSVHQPVVFGFPDIIGHLPRPVRRLYLRAVDRLLLDPLLAGEINTFRAELGLTPVRRVFDRWIHSPQLVIGLFPGWFAPPQPDWPPHVHLAGFSLFDDSDSRPLGADLASFLDAGEPPIVFTAGSAHAQSEEFFRVSVEVCRASKRRGLLLTRFADQLPPQLPEWVYHVDYAPFSQLLPRTCLIVHHGGIGTVAQAFAAGVPQLVVPCAHDQPDNAVRVRRLGVGDLLLPRQYQVNRTLKLVEGLLESASVRDNCKLRAQQTLESRTLETACTLIEEVSGHSS